MKPVFGLYIFYCSLIGPRKLLRHTIPKYHVQFAALMFQRGVQKSCGFITKLCTQQAEVIRNLDDKNVRKARPMKYKSLKLDARMSELSSQALSTV